MLLLNVMKCSWQNRIKSLMKQNLYVEAIALGLAFYDNTALAAYRLPRVRPMQC